MDSLRSAAFLVVAPFLEPHVARLCVARAALLIEIVGPVRGGWRS